MARDYGGRWVPTGETVGQGGQGQVLWVTDGPTGDRFVLKRLLNPRRLGRLEAEVTALRELASPRIPALVDFSLEEPAYIVTPYAGPTLNEWLDTRQLSLDEAVDLARDVVEAVVDAHKAGVIHRDIKPSNVVIQNGRASLIDFGICQFIDGRFLNTVVDEAFGARAFAAPEMELGAENEPGPSADVYSLGKLIYWLVSGGHTFARENFTDAARARIPSPRGVERGHIERWISRTVVESPDKRIDAPGLLRRIEEDSVLMRRGLNAVGVPNQVCPVCGRGSLARVDSGEAARLGVRIQPVNVPEEVSLRLLRCGFCGYIQTHLIQNTKGQGLWEI